MRHDFNSPQLTITAGTSLQTRAVFDRGLQQWVPVAAAPAPLPDPSDPLKPHLYERRITVEQFVQKDFKDDGYLDNPQAAGVDAGADAATLRR